jgi:hypothetical protein
MVKKVVFSVLIWQAIIFLFAVIATHLLPLKETFIPRGIEYGKELPYWIRIWGNFDGIHYMNVAVRGYQLFTQPFFPLFPILMWLPHKYAHIPTLISGITASHIAFFLTLPILFLLLKKDEVVHKFLFFIILLSYPTSFFYGAVYNDALFFLFACSTILFSRNKKWFFASVMAALATLTRLNGLALAVYIGCEYVLSDLSVTDSWKMKLWLKQIQKKLQPLAIIRSGIFSILLIPLAFIGYLAYTQSLFGSWQVLFQSMSVWNQSHITFPPIVFWYYAKILVFSPIRQLNYWVAFLELAAVLFYCFIAFFSFRKIRFSYWFFFVVSILIPWLTGTFQGMPRYGLHLYPFFLAVSLLVSKEKNWQKFLYFVSMMLIALFVITLFTRGYFVT